MCGRTCFTGKAKSTSNPMSSAAFDLYRKIEGDSEWLGTFTSPEIGIIEARRLAKVVSGRYRPYDQTSGTLIFDDSHPPEPS
jgi:hypothetical protein